MTTNNPTHAELWRMAVDEGRQSAADESEANDGWEWLTMPEIVDRIIAAFIVGLAFAGAGRIVRPARDNR